MSNLSPEQIQYL